MSYLVHGAPYILWDNIVKGTQISCPHIERANTASTYVDRILGITGNATVSSSAIHLFTGNNINAKGDLASRSLNVRLEVDRHDPENRAFKHTDPIAWTSRHRGKIMRALYTVLVGNPQLRLPEDAPAETRFKLWWRLIGSAVEHAAALAQPNESKIEFKKLFLEQEEDDAETMTLGGALGIIERQEWAKGLNGFTSADVAAFLNGADVDGATLRDFLFPQAPHRISAVAVGKVLAEHLGNPVKVDKRQLTLRAHVGHARAKAYTVHVLKYDGYVEPEVVAPVVAEVEAASGVNDDEVNEPEVVSQDEALF